MIGNLDGQVVVILMASLWVWVSVTLFVLLLVCLEIGDRIGKRRISASQGKSPMARICLPASFTDS